MSRPALFPVSALLSAGRFLHLIRCTTQFSSTRIRPRQCSAVFVSRCQLHFHASEASHGHHFSESPLHETNTSGMRVEDLRALGVLLDGGVIGERGSLQASCVPSANEMRSKHFDTRRISCHAFPLTCRGPWTGLLGRLWAIHACLLRKADTVYGCDVLREQLLFAAAVKASKTRALGSFRRSRQQRHRACTPARDRNCKHRMRAASTTCLRRAPAVGLQ